MLADRQYDHTMATVELLPPTHWPSASPQSSLTQFSASLELDERILRIVRQLACGEAPASRIVVWSREHVDAQEASLTYDALAAHASSLQFWSVAAAALGSEWLDPTVSGIVASFVQDREDARERQLMAEIEAREQDEKRRAEERAITVFFTNRNKRFQLLLQRGLLDAGVFWTVEFEEKWERERFWDWLCWQRARFNDFAADLTRVTSLELERRLLREMLATEQAVKKAGLGSGGRRPLRFWRGEL